MVTSTAERRPSETWGRCMKIIVFIVIYEFIMSCKKYVNACTLVMDCFCALSSVIFVFMSLVASHLGK